MTITELVASVKRYANTNYKKGWDVVVEAMTDDEIAEMIKGCKTELGAIRKVGGMVVLQAERRREIESATW